MTPHQGNCLFFNDAAFVDKVTAKSTLISLLLAQKHGQSHVGNGQMSLPLLNVLDFCLSTPGQVAAIQLNASTALTDTLQQNS